MPINTTTNPDGRINASNAGVFSNAAYQPAKSSTAALGANWREDASLSVATGNPSDPTNQMRVFVNDATKQVVFAFKGTDNLSNGVSDITDSGASAYKDIHDAAKASYDRLFSPDYSQYSGYQIITTGHSLGGGMAQSFALENKLNGFGQNALPIATDTFKGYLPGDPMTLVSSYQANNQFIEVNVAGDIATLTYSSIGHQIYLDNKPITLPSYLGVIADLGKLTALATAGAGLVATAGAGAKAHSLDVLNPLAAEYPVGADGRLILPEPAPPLDILGFTTTKTINADGTFQVTGTDTLGNSVIGNYSKDGILIKDSWSTFDLKGTDSFQTLNGQVVLAQTDVITRYTDNSTIRDIKNISTNGSIQTEQLATYHASQNLTQVVNLSNNKIIASGIIDGQATFDQLKQENSLAQQACMADGFSTPTADLVSALGLGNNLSAAQALKTADQRYTGSNIAAAPVILNDQALGSYVSGKATDGSLAIKLAQQNPSTLNVLVALQKLVIAGNYLSPTLKKITATLSATEVNAKNDSLWKRAA